tara:strand:- start:526 stop:756 length:231 start_codon:yes stop_codon:yes gene_type:complete
MKLICLNVDECGHTELIEEGDIVDVNDFRCSQCCSLALPYTGQNKPIAMESDEVFEEKSKQLIATLYNLIKIPKGE